jgi:hypothetical protein
VPHLLTTSNHADPLPRNTSTMEQIRNAIAAKINQVTTLARMATTTSGKKVEKRMATITLVILSQLLQAGRELQVCI